MHAQLGGTRLVAQREVQGAAHLHRARLRLPGQARLAAAQLRAEGGEVRAGCGAHVGAGEGERGEFRWEGRGVK